MNETLDKLNEICGLARIVAKICMALLVIGIVVSIIMIGLVALYPDFLTDIFEIGGTTITNGQILATSVTAIFGGALGIVILYYLDCLFTNIRDCNTPFTNKSVKYLETISILLVIFTTSVPAASAIAAYAFSTAVVMEFNIAALLVAALVYVLSLIFKHGTSLQKESDAIL